MIRIAAVVPTFDRPGRLTLAVASILAQTSPADEVIVVDNGSRPVEGSLLPEGVRLIRIAARAGVSAARNAGVAAAISDFVAFLDDDDRWEETYLAEVRAAIEAHPVRPDIILANKFREVDGIASPYKMIETLDGLRERLLYTNPGVAGQNLTVHRAFHVESHPGFRTSLRASEDRAYLIDAIDAGAEICLAPRAVAVKVMHPGDQLTDGRRIWKVLQFSAIYWRSMGRMQRIDNARKVLHALRDRLLLRTQRKAV